jgi:hypothetical protein
VLGFAGVDGPLNTLALMLITVNALNLLPIEPLDGGQLFGVLLYSRNRHIEIVVRAITAAGIITLSLLYTEWIFVLIGVFMLINLGARKRQLAEAEKLAPLDLPGDPAALSDAQRRTLYRSIWNLAPQDIHPKWRGAHRLQAQCRACSMRPARVRLRAVPPRGCSSRGSWRWRSPCSPPCSSYPPTGRSSRTRPPASPSRCRARSSRHQDPVRLLRSGRPSTA